jgi:hypothetical protein
VFLLRGARRSGPVAGLVGVVVGRAGTGVYWLFTAGLPVLSPFLLFVVAMTAVHACPMPPTACWPSSRSVACAWR